MSKIYKKKTTIIDPKTGEKRKGESKKWWGRYRDASGVDHRIPLSPNKYLAQQMLAELIDKTERQRAGVMHPAEEEMQKPIKEHLDAYEKHLKTKSVSKSHASGVRCKLRRIVDACRWKNVAQIKRTEVEAFLSDLRELHGVGIQTVNHYLQVVKSFLNWLTINEMLIRNPLLGMAKLNARLDRRHDRRALSEEEFSLLIRAAETGPPSWGLIGPDRAMLYVLAAWTGFRKGELGSLTLRNFKLDAEIKTVTIEASYSKRRREDTQILHPDLVEYLQDWLAQRKPTPDEILFPISARTCKVERATSKMIKFDIESARAFWIDEATTDEERQTREASDMLTYRDSRGKYADFHCLRHTFITNLCRAKVSPKTAQVLARHSDINLTLNIYTHIDQPEQIEAINSLPSVPGLKRRKKDDGNAAS